ncbi:MULTISPECIES: PIN domain-containing protein [Pseudomonas]|uniref:PIN domain-containing protein n=1 Tax=Pseudomonas putida NBRC 14164 TaxID=1211579 RepID=A0ABM7ECR2_PSEPU|nr:MULTISPECIES: PIN domain-containing protein [Pseudomonas]EKT4463287.1 PIN domain-containing protein [Pseudomonas putida]EKT4556760.1 PIN domain-containing protein [Pseudomonas putida]ELF6205875.1 PIN domain-containing protein [Pseudomonas putida]MCX9139483.1 PIN domain-containing protein [Pseudomonas sp. DCB_PUT]MDD1974148.1 PIN domain-containing protein [Pseudomonas putida]
MKHSPFTAIYDANVLYPAPLRDFLMNLALTGIYRARWSAGIHDEWKRNLLLNRPDLTPEHVDRTSSLMDAAVPDALVTDYDSPVEGLDLPDEDDRHVLAAAIKCNASVIVTFNLKDFPKSVLGVFDIEPLHPDDFIADLWDLDKAAVLEAAQRQRISLKNPPHSVQQYLDRLLQQKLPETVKLLSGFKFLL